MIGDESNEHRLTVQVFGAEPSVGRIYAYIFSSKSDFLKVPMKDHDLSTDPKGEALFIFHLPEGSYSVCAYHDSNGNGKLDKGFLGIPKELVAFSNQAKGLFGPPAYRATLIELKQDTAIKLKLGKAKD